MQGAAGERERERAEWVIVWTGSAEILQEKFLKNSFVDENKIIDGSETSSCLKRLEEDKMLNLLMIWFWFWFWFLLRLIETNRIYNQKLK